MTNKNNGYAKTIAGILGGAVVAAITTWSATNAGDAVSLARRALREAEAAQRANAELTDELEMTRDRIGVLNRNLDDLEESLRRSATKP